MCKSSRYILSSILSFILFLQGTIAFPLNLLSSSSNARLSFLVRHLSDCDFDGLVIGFGDAPSEEGRKLAMEFERELKMRNEQSNRRRLQSQEEEYDVVSSSSAGFFTGHGQSVYRFPLDNNPRQPVETLRDDYSLTSNNNNNSSVALPVIFAMALVSIYIAVGLTGGITEDGVDLQDLNAIGDAVHDSVYL